MSDREEIIGTIFVVLLLIIWADFVFYDSPDFAGSLTGGIFGITGSLLMLAPLLYSVIKRTKPIRTAVTRHVSMKTLLAWHIYAGLLGSILVMIHTGNKFESTLGITLTAVTLTVVVSGFVGRYVLRRCSQEIREKQELLTSLHTAYEKAAAEVAANRQQLALVQPFTNPFARLFAGLLNPPDRLPAVTSPYTMVRLAEGIADVEYAIKAHDTFNLWFRRSLKLHIAISTVLYVLLLLHIWAGIYFGLRWFQ
jgi:hypothetical protein